MRILFLIQTFRDLPQIERLVRTIKRSSPKATILISHNPEAFRIADGVFADLDDIYVRYTQHMARGDGSLLREYLACLRWALDGGIAFDWVVNMTGQCYLTRPLSELEQTLSTSSYDGYMQWFDAFSPGSDNPWGPGEASFRYCYHYRQIIRQLKPVVRLALSIPRRIVNAIQPFARVHTIYGLQVGWRASRRPFSQSMPLYAGLFFKTLSRRAAIYLCEYGDDHPQVLAYFRKTMLPEEGYPQTVLLTSGMSFSHDDLYYTKWDPRGLGRPNDLGPGDVQHIVAGKGFFARKIDPARDPRILDLLDARLEPDDSGAL